MASHQDQKKLNIIEKASIVDQEMMVGGRGFFSQLSLLARRQMLSYYFVQPPLWKVLLRSKSKKERMSPEFLSIGAVRTGTSLLSDYIMQHPCVALPLAKEIGLGMFPIERYLRGQFPTVAEGEEIKKAHGKVMTGFCSPVVPYAGFAHLASQVASPNNTKVVVILRNPVDRTFAHWRWDCALLEQVKKDPLWDRYPEFDRAMDIELDYISQGGGGLTAAAGAGGAGYIQHSIYLPFLKVMREFYSKDNTLYIKSEDFFSDPVAIAKQVYSFLELPEYEPIHTDVKNAGPVKDKMSDESRAKLEEFFKPRNEALYEYLGRDFQW